MSEWARNFWVKFSSILKSKDNPQSEEQVNDAPEDLNKEQGDDFTEANTDNVSSADEQLLVELQSIQRKKRRR